MFANNQNPHALNRRNSRRDTKDFPPHLSGTPDFFLPLFPRSESREKKSERSIEDFLFFFSRSLFSARLVFFFFFLHGRLAKRSLSLLVQIPRYGEKESEEKEKMKRTTIGRLLHSLGRKRENKKDEKEEDERTRERKVSLRTTLLKSKGEEKEEEEALSLSLTLSVVFLESSASVFLL